MVGSDSDGDSGTHSGSNSDSHCGSHSGIESDSVTFGTDSGTGELDSGTGYSRGYTRVSGGAMLRISGYSDPCLFTSFVGARRYWLLLHSFPWDFSQFSWD